jgi:hypothetical protein
MSAPAVAVSADGKKCAAAWKDVRKGAPRVWWAFAAEPRFAKDMPVDEPKAERDHPSLAVDEAGTFWVAWEEGRGEKARVVARSSAQGEAPRVLAEAAGGVPAFPVLAAGAGLVVAAWETSTAGPGVFARVLADRPK